MIAVAWWVFVAMAGTPIAIAYWVRRALAQRDQSSFDAGRLSAPLTQDLIDQGGGYGRNP
jgi:hypothetical protein